VRGRLPLRRGNLRCTTPLASGSRLGVYEVLEPIGAGGMGEVYLARDTRLGREVAIKVLPADRMHDEGRRRRFLQEAQSASALNHPHIVTVHDIVHERVPASAPTEPDVVVDFLVMENVPEMLDRKHWDHFATWRKNLEDRQRGMTMFAADLAATGDLREDLTPDQVADVLWLAQDVRNYDRLVRERGWTPDEFQQWYVDTVAGAILAAPG